MIGNLIIDKSSMNISYFLATVCIINRNGGKMTRQEFVKQMAGFMNVSPFDNSGREVRTPYNKSILPRYFGFVDRAEENGTEFLVLTHRGRKLVEMVGEDPGEDADNRYSINSKYREEFIDLIFDSVIFDSFGKNNCGALTSNTDVEPPKVVFKAIQELGGATAEEICYVMYGLNKGVFSSFSKAIEAVLKDRSSSQNDYSRILDGWGVSNIVNDFKIANIFTNDNICLLVRDSEKVYNFSSTLGQQRLNQIKSIDAIYRPFRLFVYTDGDEKTIQKWIRDTVLGRVGNNDFVFQYKKGDTMIGYKKGGTFIPGIFENALLKAFKYPKKNVYIIFNGVSESELPVILDKYYPLLKIIDDLADSKHGWSESFIEDEDTYRFIEAGTSTDLEYNRVRIPSNLQMVGVNILKNIPDNINYDFEIQRAFVKSVNPGTVSSIKYKTNLQSAFERNKIYFGAPGTGKSHELNLAKDSLLVNNKDYDYERVTFHPDYSYANFVGTYKPVPCKDDNGKDSITYEYIAGPFMRIYSKALINANWGTGNVKPFLLIVEEINRANAAAVFGDVFQLLDREDNVSEYPIQTSKDMREYLVKEFNKAGMQVSAEAFKEIRIPDNMFIWATMNSADQGVFPMDTAFKRRWEFEYLGIDKNETKIAKNFIKMQLGEKVKKVKIVRWNDIRKAINKRLASLGINEDKQLGPYFISKSIIDPDIAATNGKGKEINWASFSKTFKSKVIMYLFEDAGKQKRDKIFKTGLYNDDKYGEKKYLRYSNICKKFDEIGLEVFVDEISSKVEEISDGGQQKSSNGASALPQTDSGVRAPDSINDTNNLNRNDNNTVPDSQPD